MKTLFGLSLVALLLSGCNSGEEMTEEDSLFDRYDEDGEEIEEPVDEEITEEEEDVDSVGPSDIPADLVPSR